MKALNVLDTTITYFNIDNENYISLTDMLKSKDGDFFISVWLRNEILLNFQEQGKNYTILIKSQAGLNSYKLSVKEWVNKTNSIGIVAKTDRYGGTYPHKDIAFEFGVWTSPKFKILLIKEFERLKAEEQKQLVGMLKENYQR